MKFFLLYLMVINITAIVITLLDKSFARKHKWRIKESTLLAVSVFGGSIAMLITMKAIRHKTQKKKFMIGIPAIIFLQILCIGLALYLIFMR